MVFNRSFSNSVVLPDGKVLVLGGMPVPIPFSDVNAVLTPELWDPVTEKFQTMAPSKIPRTYHSVALLLPDGRVMSAGGGLCGKGCSANHFDAEIFTPPNFFEANGSLASRPKFSGAPIVTRLGSQFTVKVTSQGVSVASFVLMRMGATTHSVNNDQRRVPLTTSCSTTKCTLIVPADAGIALPGYYMLFAMSTAGVCSMASVMQITP